MTDSPYPPVPIRQPYPAPDAPNYIQKCSAVNDAYRKEMRRWGYYCELIERRLRYDTANLESASQSRGTILRN